ncbi:MAG: HEAT repeat domain-containing protein [Thermoanaerobaculia bacterium]|nr:HEAT repeat domain-containing protein [Thermoanaerobaculia bacterium]
MNLTKKLAAVASQDPWRRSEQARALVIEGLRSAEEAVRMLAVGLVAERLDPELAAELERLLDHDPADEIRAQAIATLGSVFEEMGFLDSWKGKEFSDAPMTRAQFRSIKGKLETIYRDAGAPAELRRRALEALVHAPEPWHGEAVSSHWSGDDPQWRVTAVRCMGHVEDFDAQLLEALGSDSLDLKHAALWALLGNPLEEAADETLRLATSEQTPRELRLTAFEVLMALRPRGSLEALHPLLDSDDKAIAEAAGEAIAELAADEELDEDFEPGDGDAEDPSDGFGLYDGQCAACDAFTRVDDMSLCEECAAKLDRDMIRQRDWDYSATAWVCPENLREELRAEVIREHGAKLELIAPSPGARKPENGRGVHRRKKRRKA